MVIKQQLLEKIAAREARVAIIGLGYVGLPLAVTFAEAGFQVIGIDVDGRKVRAIGAGESYIEDVPGDCVARLVRGGTLCATSDYAALQRCDVVSICVPTPLGKTRTPDISYIVRAADTLAHYLHPGHAGGS